jgi:mono/diheme cytochrome c family protein
MPGTNFSTKAAMFLLAIIVLTAPGVRAAGTADIRRGRSLYLEYCASCHGVNADGRGPLRHSLTTPPTNLRHLSQLYGNPLPEEEIARFIDGRADVAAHGPRDMPVWGRIWHGRQDREALHQLIEYLQSIQTTVRQAMAR